MKATVEAGAARLGGEDASSGRERVAVLVVHGMGQQVQYETLDRVVQGFARVDAGARKADLRAVRWGERKDQEFRRAEVRLGGERDGVDVHVYEGYWAPITSGKVTLRDVVSFLVRAAWNGMKNARAGFDRWSFGRKWPTGARWGTLLWLVVLSAFLLSLALLNVVAVTIVAASFAAPAWLRPDVLGGMTKLTVLFLACSVLLAVYIGVAVAFRRLRRGSESVAASIPAWVALGLFVASGILAGLGSVAYAFGDDALPKVWQFAPAETWMVVGVWGGVFLASLVVRSLLIDYFGDVAAYVAPHALDRFTQARADVRRAVTRVAEAIYDAKDADGRPLYSRVAIVGHSLGSVVAYDTLNALLRDDAFEADSAKRRDAARRTCLFLTFGSPLDKTAFLFATAARDTTPTREALAALSQPLILDASHRPFPWINVHSHADPVSGRLDLYDGPDQTPRVINVRDVHARTPLVAHEEYWRNELVWRILRDALVVKRVTVMEKGLPVEVTIPVASEAPSPAVARAPR